MFKRILRCFGIYFSDSEAEGENESGSSEDEEVAINEDGIKDDTDTEIRDEAEGENERGSPVDEEVAINEDGKKDGMDTETKAVGKKTDETSKEEERARKWLNSGSNELKIVLVGEVGVGKSTLTNGIIGEEVAETKCSAMSVTKNVKYNATVINGITVSVFDTPGFDDPEKEDEETVAEIIKETGGVIDLVLICLDIRMRLKKAGLKIFKYLNALLTDDSQWERALIVLTHANELKDGNLQESRDDFDRSIRELITKKEYGSLNEKTAMKIPVVPAGFKHRDLPGIKDWLSNIWLKAFFHINSKQAFVKLIEHRIRGSGEEIDDVLPQYRSIDIRGKASRDGSFITYLSSSSISRYILH